MIGGHKDQQDGKVLFKTLNCKALTDRLGISEEFNIVEKYFVDKESPSEDTLERSFWDNIYTFGGIDLGQGSIISGKKIGHTIGIPTANLDFGPQKIQEHKLIPGVYYGTCNLVEHNLPKEMEHLGNRDLPMVMSIGFNVQYEQKNINYEVLILEDFGDSKFYGSTLQVTLYGFIRCESKFDSFDQFIRSMECDISVAKQKTNLILNN